MKKILFTLFLCLSFCMPSFAQSVFVPDITTEQAEKVVINFFVTNGWSLKSETEHSVDFYKTESVHDP